MHDATWPLAESNEATQNVMTESTVKPLSAVIPLSCNNWMMICKRESTGLHAL
jgi:hypothetical protein